MLALKSLKVLAPNAVIDGTPHVLTTAPDCSVESGVACFAFLKERLQPERLGDQDARLPFEEAAMVTSRSVAIALATSGYRLVASRQSGGRWNVAPVLREEEFHLVEATAVAIASREAELDRQAADAGLAAIADGLLALVGRHATAAGDRDGERALLAAPATLDVSARTAARSAAEFILAVGADTICKEINVSSESWGMISDAWERSYIESYLAAVEARGLMGRVVEFFELDVAPESARRRVWLTTRIDNGKDIAAAGVMVPGAEVRIEVTAPVASNDDLEPVHESLLAELEAQLGASLSAVHAARQRRERAP